MTKYGIFLLSGLDDIVSSMEEAARVQEFYRNLATPCHVVGVKDSNTELLAEIDKRIIAGENPLLAILTVSLNQGKFRK
jgi:hypothetical protein